MTRGLAVPLVILRRALIVPLVILMRAKPDVRIYGKPDVRIYGIMKSESGRMWLWGREEGSRPL